MAQIYSSNICETKYFDANNSKDSSVFVWSNCPLAWRMRAEGWAVITDDKTYKTTNFEDFNTIIILAELNWCGFQMSNFEGIKKLVELSFRCLDCPKDIRVASLFGESFFNEKDVTMYQQMKVASKIIHLPCKVVQMYQPTIQIANPAFFYLRVLLNMLRHCNSHQKSVTDKLSTVTDELNNIQMGKQVNVLAAWEYLVKTDLERVVKCLNNLNGIIINGWTSYSDVGKTIEEKSIFIESQLTSLQMINIHSDDKKQISQLKKEVNELIVYLVQIEKILPS